jgi:hypothetical protein
LNIFKPTRSFSPSIKTCESMQYLKIVWQDVKSFGVDSDPLRFVVKLLPQSITILDDNNNAALCHCKRGPSDLIARTQKN